MAEINSTESRASTFGVYSAHNLDDAMSYHDATMLELQGAKGLLLAFAQASGRLVDTDAAVGLWAIVEKLEAAQHYAGAAWKLQAPPTPVPKVN